MGFSLAMQFFAHKNLARLTLKMGWNHLPPIFFCRKKTSQTKTLFNYTETDANQFIWQENSSDIPILKASKHHNLSNNLSNETTKILVVDSTILFMEEILHQLKWRIYHYLQGFVHVKWCRISSINSISTISDPWKKNMELLLFPYWYSPETVSYTILACLVFRMVSFHHGGWMVQLSDTPTIQQKTNNDQITQQRQHTFLANPFWIFLDGQLTFWKG